MTFMKMAAAAGAMAVLAACGGSGATLSTDEMAFLDDAMSGTGQADPSRDDSFADLINGFRADEGGPTVRYDSRLDAAAQAHANDLLANDYFSHTSRDGREVDDRIREQGYNPVAWGENLARGQRNEAEALAAWINSPPHLRLLRAETVEDFGLAMAGSGSDRTWVLVMGAER